MKCEFTGRLHPPSLCALTGGTIVDLRGEKCYLAVLYTSGSGNPSHTLQQINLYLNYSGGLIRWFLLGSRSLPNLDTCLH